MSRVCCCVIVAFCIALSIRAFQKQQQSESCGVITRQQEATVITSGFGAWFKALKECAGKKSECGECLEERTTTIVSQTIAAETRKEAGSKKFCWRKILYFEDDQDNLFVQ